MATQHSLVLTQPGAKKQCISTCGGEDGRNTPAQVFAGRLLRSRSEVSSAVMG